MLLQSAKRLPVIVAVLIATLTAAAKFASFVAPNNHKLVNEDQRRAPAVGEAAAVIVAEAAGFEPARGLCPQPA